MICTLHEHYQKFPTWTEIGPAKIPFMSKTQPMFWLCTIREFPSYPAFLSSKPRELSDVILLQWLVALLPSNISQLHCVPTDPHNLIDLRTVRQCGEFKSNPNRGRLVGLDLQNPHVIGNNIVRRPSRLERNRRGQSRRDKIEFADRELIMLLVDVVVCVVDDVLDNGALGTQCVGETFRIVLKGTTGLEDRVFSDGAFLQYHFAEFFNGRAGFVLRKQVSGQPPGTANRGSEDGVCKKTWDEDVDGNCTGPVVETAFALKEVGSEYLHLRLVRRWKL